MEKYSEPELIREKKKQRRVKTNYIFKMLVSFH